MNTLKKILFSVLCSCLLVLPTLSAQATTTTSTLNNTITGPADIMLANSGLSSFSLGTVIAFVIQAALSLLGIIFLVIIVFAGYRWMTAAGNEEAIKKSQEAIKRAIIGLIIVLMAYAITYFVFKQLPFNGGTTTTTTPPPGGGSTP